jgi:uncharacterized protein HemX
MGVEVLLGAALLGGAGASLYSGQKQLKATKKAAAQQQAMAEQLAKDQERQYNRLNQKKPDISALQAQNAMSGTPQTQLTDMGVDPLLMLLSRDRMLGG